MLGKNKEIVLDIVPGFPPFIEIECKSEKDINNVISKLKLNKKNTKFDI
jgi:adenylate cyclase class IV